MFHRAILFALLFFSLAAKPNPNKVLLVDTHTLSDLQRRAVREAEESWTRQTRGCIQFKDSLDGTHVIRMTPPDKYDDEHVTTIGMCSPEIGDCRIIEIAFGRVADFDQAVIVAAHEFGHALGLRHICGDTDTCPAGDHSLMTKNINNAWIGLSAADWQELKRATGCAPDGG